MLESFFIEKYLYLINQVVIAIENQMFLLPSVV